ncbi:thioesterase II family protein [Streptomyces sp. 2A115]|uniref:thioesterase II family protein n=1 Tax=Streptomyces sp. 2A115 TaxID=3457439 RepID=UPI003FD45FE0
MSTEVRSNWFRVYRTTELPRRRLLVLPHAGGSASFFHDWGEAFDDGTQVMVAQYPGRQDRLVEPGIERMEELADEVTAALLPFLDVPLTLFGHSMGASLAYEIALRLESRHQVSAQSLHVSSRKAPHRLTPKALHLAGDDVLVAEMRRLGGTVDALLDDPDLLEMVLPAIRSDFAVVGTYGPRVPVPVSCPVHAYVGDSDPVITATDMAAWADVAPRGFTQRHFTGGHFYLIERRAELLRALGEGW